MSDDVDPFRIERDLRRQARGRALAGRVDRLERVVARVNALLDGASVTLLPVAEKLRPPSGPDVSVELQRIVSRRVQGTDEV
jgi:hypothetical protein